MMFYRSIALSTCLFSLGCDDAVETPVVPPGPSVQANEAPAENSAESPPPQSREGTMTFRIDGEERAMSHFQPSSNAMVGPTVNLKGQPSPDADEKLEISISLFRMGEVTLPMEVESESPVEAMRAGHLPRIVLISYRTAEDYYAARGAVFLDSLENGVLSGHIDELALVGSGDSRGEQVTLSNLRFQVTVE